MNTGGHETALQAKIRAALSRHPVLAEPKDKPFRRGAMALYGKIAKELGCSVGAVQTVERTERMYRLGKEIRERRVEPLPFNKPAVVVAPVMRRLPDVQVPDDFPGCKDFPGWVCAFGKLSLVINGYLQIARVMGSAMPASWLSNMRDICETAQLRSEQDRDLKKLWPNGPPAGSGDFGDFLGRKETGRLNP